MTVLTWDDVGEKIFQSGVDRGVLFLQDGRAVPWNGLTSVEESSDGELKSFYLDGIKYLENLTPREYIGRLKAFTYPDEFDSFNGITSVVEGTEGFDVYEQPPKSFNLSYRTRIGNDIDGEAHGYKIHILYNILAQSESFSYATSDDSGIKPVEFEWTLTGIPPNIDQVRPAVHFAIDSTKTPVEILEILENQLYGTSFSNPSLPSIKHIMEMFGYLGALIIIDHGDGTWTAIDESDTYITMLDDTTFQIDNADAEFIYTSTFAYGQYSYGSGLYGSYGMDLSKYTISSTNVK